MIEALSLQTTPSVPTGGGPSPLALGLLLVVAGWLVQTQTGVDLVGLLPSLGGGDDSDASSTSSSGGGGGIVGFVLSINGLAIGVLTLLSALLLGGAIGVPADTAVPFVVALELLAAALILDELGELTFRTFALVVVATTVIALSAAGEPVLSAVLNSPVGPLATVGAILLGWRWLGQDRVRRIVVRGEVEDGNGGGQ